MENVLLKMLALESVILLNQLVFECQIHVCRHVNICMRKSVDLSIITEYGILGVKYISNIKIGSRIPIVKKSESYKIAQLLGNNTFLGRLFTYALPPLPTYVLGRIKI